VQPQPARRQPGSNLYEHLAGVNDLLLGEIRRAAHGYEPTREAAMAAFAKSWRWRDSGGRSSLQSPPRMGLQLALSVAAPEHAQLDAVVDPLDVEHLAVRFGVAEPNINAVERMARDRCVIGQ
jgi:hypothetical protein